MAEPGAGDRAPDFSLPGTRHRTYRLGDYRGRVVVLVFYPGDHSPVGTEQLIAYSHDIRRFEDLDAQVLALSPQDVGSHEDFDADSGPFAFPLLADVDKEVGRRYGIVGPLGFYRRAVFVIDGAGVVRYAHRSLGGVTYRPVDELVGAVQAVQPHPTSGTGRG